MAKFTLKIVFGVIILIVIFIAIFLFTQNQKEVVKIGVLTSWVLEGPFYVAQEKGFFEEEGIKVELIEIGSFDEFVPALISGEILLAENTADSFIIQSTKETNIKQILRKASIFGVDGIVAIEEIKEIKDLKGQKIAVQTISPSHFLLLNKLKEVGLSSSDVEILPTNAGDAGAAFLTGAVDVAVTWEPWLSRASERSNSHVLYSTKDEPDFIYDILMTRGDLTAKEEEEVKAVLRAWFKALDWIEKNPEETMEIFSKGLGLPEEEIEFFLKKVKFTDYQSNLDFFGEPNSLGPIKEYTDNTAQIWLDEKIISQKPNPDELIDSSYLNKLYQEFTDEL